MKTAEERNILYMVGTLDRKGVGLQSALDYIEEQMAKLKLDAYEAGMTEAAEECVKQGAAKSSIDCYNAILTARDKKEGL